MTSLTFYILLTILVLIALALLAVGIIWFVFVKPAVNLVFKVSAHILNNSPYSS